MELERYGKMGFGSAEPVLQDKSITSNGTYTADEGYDGIGTATVNVPNPSTGTVSITSNGTTDVTDYASASVNVQPTLQDKTITANGTYSADIGYDGLDEVTVNVPNPSSGSLSISANGTYDVTEKASAVVNVPQPSGNINITTTAQTDVTNYATAQVVDADLVAGNIKKDVDILGVVGTFEGGSEPQYGFVVTEWGMVDWGTVNACGYPKKIKIKGFPPIRGANVVPEYYFYAYRDTCALCKVQEIELPNNLDRVEAYAFYSMSYLNSINLSNTIKAIDSYAFSGCERLVLTSLPESIQTIGREAFSICSLVAFTEIPASVTSLSRQAFMSCLGLTSITFKGTPSSIDSTVFQNCTNLTNIYVPWAEGAVANAPWGATNATIWYDQTV